MTAPGKVIVLGAGGFFGKAIATGLEQAGHDVARIDRAAGGELLDPEGLNQMIASTDPAARAQARVVLRRIEQDWYAVADALEPGAGTDRRERERARKMLAESILASEPLFRLRPWFLSEQFSQLDAAVAPVLWRLPRWDIDVASLAAGAPAIERYAAKAFARPSFLRSLSEAERGMRAR